MCLTCIYVKIAIVPEMDTWLSGNISQVGLPQLIELLWVALSNNRTVIIESIFE